MSTYKITNLRGLVANKGSKVKQMTKHANAARLQAPNTSSLSHLLTMRFVSFLDQDAGHGRKPGTGSAGCAVPVPLPGARICCIGLLHLAATTEQGELWPRAQRCLLRSGCECTGCDTYGQTSPLPLLADLGPEEAHQAQILRWEVAHNCGPGRGSSS